MRVRMLRLAAGPGGVFQPGAEMTVADAEGVELIRRGYAVPVPEAHETATSAPTEVRQPAASGSAKRRTQKAGGVE